MSRDEVRARFDVGPDEKLILVGGSKEPLRNALLFGNVVMAVGRLGQMMHTLVFSKHPGEQNPPVTLYEAVLAETDGRGKYLERMRTDDASAGADLVITSISSVGIMGACQRIPVVDHITDIDTRWWRGLSGVDEWEPTDLGASYLAEDIVELEDSIKALLDPESPEAMFQRKDQKKHFRLEDVEGAASKIVGHLLHYGQR
jgi:hypothetical protein